MSILEYIASYDDLIQFCGTDTELGKKHKNFFSDKESRVTTFDPYISCASSISLLGDVDIWTNPKTLKTASKKKGCFDVAKYTANFIKIKREHLEDSEKIDLKRDGFDPYAYLMAYEEDIKNEYKGYELKLIQKATLHFIEFGFELKTVDYLRYIASYNDIIVSAYACKLPETSIEEWLPIFAEFNYNLTGKQEILSGIRSVDFIFDPTKYVATYVPTKDAFTDPLTGIINDRSVTIAYITIGVINGLQPDLFNPYVFLSNYPELVKEDIYIKDINDGEISSKKLSKLWIDKFPHNIDLSKFDIDKFKVNNKISDSIEAFKLNALSKIKEHQTEILLAKSIFTRFLNSLKKAVCLSSNHDKK
jgi:chromosome condensin MukBEF MukE localization factor